MVQISLKPINIVVISCLLSSRAVKSNVNCDIDYILGASGIEVYSQGDAGYDDAAFQFASSLIDYTDTIQPTKIAFATSTSEVQDIISFVDNCDEIDTITIRSGGHAYNGISSCDDRCLQLDVSNINTFEILTQPFVDPDTGYLAASVKIGSGWKYIDLYNFAGVQGLIVLGGVCEDVFIGGNWQTSGHGVFNHALGSGLDYITEFDIILADGTLVTVNENNNYANLFYAVRGGSPGAFGVVVSYTATLFYTTNFPHSYASFTFYRFGDNAQDEDVLKTIGQLYNEASGHPTFTDSTDIGSMYMFIAPRSSTSGALGAALDFFGSHHYIFIAVIYLGRDSQVPYENSTTKADIVDGIFRDTTRLVQPFLTTSDSAIPASFMPVVTALPFFDIPAGYSQVQGSTLFDDSVYDTYAEGVVDLLNNKGLNCICTFQGGLHGGQFELNDPNQINTAHPYRDTKSFIDITLRPRNSSLSIDSQTVIDLDLQGLTDELFDKMRNEINEDDRNKRWIPYPYGDTDINNVWPNYYDNNIDLYNDLRCTKYLVDQFDLFKSDFTVEPLSCDAFTPSPTEEPQTN